MPKVYLMGFICQNLSTIDPSIKNVYICIMELLIKSLIISFAIVGLRIASSKEMVLYFLRAPYDILKRVRKSTNDKFIKNSTERLELYVYVFWRAILLDLPIYLMKPVIGCVTCMASFWTLVIEHFYFGNIDKWTILTIFVVAAFNSISYAFYEKLIN